MRSLQNPCRFAIQSLRFKFARSVASLRSEKIVQEPVSAVSKVILTRGGHLSLSDAIGSPLALALHSGRFAVTQQSLLKIPGNPIDET